MSFNFVNYVGEKDHGGRNQIILYTIQVIKPVINDEEIQNKK